MYNIRTPVWDTNIIGVSCLFPIKTRHKKVPCFTSPVLALHCNRGQSAGPRKHLDSTFVLLECKCCFTVKGKKNHQKRQIQRSLAPRLRHALLDPPGLIAAKSISAPFALTPRCRVSSRAGVLDMCRKRSLGLDANTEIPWSQFGGKPER